MTSYDLEGVKKFKVILLQFIDELVQMFPSDSDIVLCRILIKDQIPIEAVLNIFVKYFINHIDMIENRDESFFSTGTDEFCQALKLRSNIFHRIWFLENLDADDKATLWEWIVSISKLVQKCIVTK
jgi:hypothetical protein